MNKKTILIVDDEETVRNSLRRFFRKLGYETRLAKDGVDALQIMQDGGADLVLLDLHMPGFDGLETLQALKKANPQARVVIVSGLKEEEKAKTALRLGAVQYVTKPFDFEKLARLVRANLFLKESTPPQPSPTPSPIGREIKGDGEEGDLKREIRKILIIEDEDATRRMMVRTLSKRWPELQIAEASDGMQAIERAKLFLPDLLILDLMLPGLDGISVLSELKEHSQLQSALVLGITAYNSPANIRNLHRLGAATVLVKPFSPKELERVLRPYFEGDTALLSPSTNGRVGVRGIKSPPPLLNLVTFLGLFFSSVSFAARSEAKSAGLTKNAELTEVEEKKKPVVIQRIAVSQFESSNLYIAGRSFSDTLAGFISQELKMSRNGHAGMILVERLDLEKILAEQKLVLTGAIKKEKKTNWEGIESVDALITGTVRTMEYFGSDGGSIVVTVKVIHVDTGEILWSTKQEARYYTVNIDKKSLGEELINRAAKKIAKKMKSELFSKKAKLALSVG